MNIWNDISAKISGATIDSIALRVAQGRDRLEEVRGDRRREDLVRDRHRIAKIARKEGYTLQEIGDYLNRDHSTIFHYLNHYRP